MAVELNNAVAAILEAVAAEEGKMPPKKALLVEAAVLCFAETGYDGTSTRMIAERAGVAEATIFRHFGTKKALLQRITEPVVKRLLAPALEGEAVRIQTQTGGDIRAFAKAVMQSRLTFADRYAPLVRIMLQEFMVNTDLREMVLEHAGQSLTRMADQLFSRFVDSGQVKPIPPAQFLGWAIPLLIGYYVKRTILAPGNWDDEAEIDAMLDMVMNGIALRRDKEKPETSSRSGL